MGIETVQWYHPKHKLPLYTRVTSPNQNSYECGETYEIRIEDENRATEKGDKPPYNYTHEAILVGEWSVKLSELPAELLAFDTNTTSKREALQRLLSDEPPYPSDKKMVVLTFLRKDKVQEFVKSGAESIPDDFNKRVTET